jgi:hypothetical protein
MISRREQQDTGFWDNILARGYDGRVQIAYGHHRLEALRRIKNLTDMVDIPVKTFTDATMIQIMANENMEEWRLGAKVIDEMVRVTKKFLEENLGEAKKYSQLEKVNLDAHSIGVACISRFLGWNTTRVSNSLERLRLIEEGTLDKEAVESMPSDNAARELVDGNYKRICVSMGIKKKVSGSYPHATSGSSRCPSPIPVKALVGVLKLEEKQSVGLFRGFKDS